MKVLVTGGTGVIGAGVVPALVAAGHEVRLLSRGAEEEAPKWGAGVECFAADVTEARSLRGAAEGCDAVLHVTGVVRESPPRVTFERVNVGGTKNVLAEARRAGVGRFIYVSSLGAERGRSGYHRSKLKGERLVERFKGDWLILRPGNVYGPGDEVLSSLLKMVRVLPAVPVVDDGGQKFQPVWYEDAGRAISLAVGRTELSRRTLELAGEDVTTMREVVELLAAITGRTASVVSVPARVASLGVQLAKATRFDGRLAQLLGVDFQLDESKLAMLLEENYVRDEGANALTGLLGVRPTPLAEGLRLLADCVPAQMPSEGVGALERKTYRADIEGSRHDAESLMGLFRGRLAEIMPVEFGAEPGARTAVEEGATLTGSLPLRGNFQVRVAEVAPRRLTLLTVEGHPLAGAVQFLMEPRGRGGVRFEVLVRARAASVLDSLTMATAGRVAQRANWVQLVERVVGLSGGEAPRGVESETETLDEAGAGAFERELGEMVARLERVRNGGVGARTVRSGRARAAAAACGALGAGVDAAAAESGEGPRAGAKLRGGVGAAGPLGQALGQAVGAALGVASALGAVASDNKSAAGSSGSRRVGGAKVGKKGGAAKKAQARRAR